MDQATEEKPYHQEGQYFDEIILKYDEELDYQLFTPGVLKLWLAILCLTFSLICLHCNAQKLLYHFVSLALYIKLLAGYHLHIPKAGFLYLF